MADFNPGDIFGIYTIQREATIEERRNRNLRDFIVMCDLGGLHVKTISCLITNPAQNPCKICTRIKQKERRARIANAVLEKKVYKNWTVIKRVGYKSRFLCRCTCGEERVIRRCNLTGPLTIKCSKLKKKRSPYKPIEEDKRWFVSRSCPSYSSKYAVKQVIKENRKEEGRK